MPTPETAYSEIEKLVQKFKNTSARERKAMNENATRQGFILPMFRALGWDTDNINEVSPEEKVSRGFVDFSFRIGGVPRYFLETKRMDEDLTNPMWIRQAVDYAWTKSVTWALLSDFEGLMVFNAETKTDNPYQAKILDFTIDTYLSKFEKLWWLSREQTALGRLDTETDESGRFSKRLPVSQELFGDLKKWREVLFNNFKLHNPMMPPNDIDNAILQLLNRLIFIRTAEDRHVERIRLRAFVRELRDRKQFKNWGAELSKLFREMDGIYNSEIFSEKRGSDGMELSPDVLEQVIEGLYQKRYILYNFNALESDVLGTVYEQYLGAVVADKSEEEKSPKKSAKQAELISEGMTVQERRAKRKSQGIYYTPSFVTKYIVQQTVGKYLEENGYNPSKPPRILDMACGSGSFLIEAFDVLDKFVMNLRGQALTPSFGHPSPVIGRGDGSEGKVFDSPVIGRGDGSEGNIFDRARQLEVLSNCIYGVDKDKQAVEVARLNLLLRALYSPEKLPKLKNFHLGDSLRPETWEMGFPEVMKDGGFDIIIGNPPYVRAENMNRDERDYYMSGAFETAYGKFDIFILFVEQAIKLLKEGGRLGFILPYAGFTQNYGLVLRKFILDTCVLETIVDLSKYKVFADASIATCIFVLRKESNPEKRLQHEISIISQDSYDGGVTGKGSLLLQKVFAETPNNTFRLNLNNDILQLVGKIDSQSVRFGDICYLITGAVLHNSETGESKERLISTKSKKGLKPYIEAKEIGRYQPPISAKFLDYKPNEVHRPKFKELFENDKIMIARIATDVKATLDYGHLYTDHTIDLAVRKDMLVNVKHRDIKISEEEAAFSQKYGLGYLLGIINAKIATWYLKNMLGMAIEINPETGRQLPIRRIDFDNPAEKSAHDEIVALVEKMLALQKERQSFTSKLYEDEIQQVERQIAYVDEEINQRVYRLYGLTDEEVKVVEGK
jgi:type I restriction-modification system DNA methylase subunit